MFVRLLNKGTKEVRQEVPFQLLKQPLGLCVCQPSHFFERFILAKVIQYV